MFAIHCLEAKCAQLGHLPDSVGFSREETQAIQDWAVAHLVFIKLQQLCRMLSSIITFNHGMLQAVEDVPVEVLRKLPI